MFIVKTAVDPEEGIIGLNGDFYILDDDGEPMQFPTEESAREFIRWNGEDPDDEYLEYVEVEA